LPEIWDKFWISGAKDPGDRLFGVLGFLQEDIAV
jgi:hypothetical protein